MRKVLAIIFLIIFSFQVIPLKAVGKLLVKGQTEEEVKHGCDDSGDLDGKAGKYNDLIFHSTMNFSSVRTIEKDKSFMEHRSDALPLSHVAEIPSPPPNA